MIDTQRINVITFQNRNYILKTDFFGINQLHIKEDKKEMEEKKNISNIYN